MPNQAVLGKYLLNKQAESKQVMNGMKFCKPNYFVSLWDGKQTWKSFQKYQWSWVSQNWTCFLKLWLSLDQNLNQGEYVTWARLPTPPLKLTLPSEPRAKSPKASTPKKGPRKRCFIPGRVKLLAQSQSRPSFNSNRAHSRKQLWEPQRGLGLLWLLTHSSFKWI